eukprot:878072-Pelagomonas_calceolata.AAC.3
MTAGEHALQCDWTAVQTGCGRAGAVGGRIGTEREEGKGRSCWRKERNGKGYIAVPAYVGS